MSANPQAASPIATSFTRITAQILRGKVLRVHPDEWTVDVEGLFDRKFWDHVPFMSPYAHPYLGAGMNLMPEEGALVSIVIPSDTSPPFVMGFLPGLRAVSGGESPTEGVAKEKAADAGLTGREPRPGPSFAANRDIHSRGDQSWKGAGDVEVRLHRSGCLEVRAGQVCRSLWFVDGERMEFCLSSRTFYPGGSCFWESAKVGAQRPTMHTEIYRCYESDDGGDLRILKGNVQTPLGEPDGDAGSSVALAAEQIAQPGTEIVYELDLARQGFSTDDGLPVDLKVRKASLARVLLDRAGGAFLRLARSLVLRILKNLRIEVGETFSVQAKTFSFTATENATVGGAGTTKIAGKIVELGAGKRGVAAQGDTVLIQIPPGTNLVGTLNGQPFAVVVQLPFQPIPGIIMTGSAVVKVP
jgi:hypothetical protein